ncbi:hypothetical protein BABINDRAFT_160007 [Babjeviella inositovora NRRL Y-12698]|uniref:Large ribosomal subunit protein uL4m n=1 Tax=Babjeviella inositovora NRRL Y-12698 TaxID=984486 RepID=A0A1E3QVS1_9ASCO|nr:uncharacterized protein BABINDRAFT_160007 [Babjeviella inositovora NRRL Y-12698]ODQ81766.1 hypothetical protein BABINDRAFT_160007 [Babjeviella inositovora NRRL Y-12698]
MLSSARTFLSGKTFLSSRFISSVATITCEKATLQFPNFQIPPKYVLASIRSFPSLEPTTFVPVSTTILNQPLRRDLLWLAAVYEADAARVGSASPPGRSELGYSRKKVRPQKGTGRARVGDNNSPTRHTGAIAMARTAPNDMSSDLPLQVYHTALKSALSHQYREGKLFVIEDHCDFVTGQSQAAKMFLKEHGFEDKKLLFVLDSPRHNLADATEKYQQKIDIVTKDAVEVRDILKANRVFIELSALKFLGCKFHRPSDLN